MTHFPIFKSCYSTHSRGSTHVRQTPFISNRLVHNRLLRASQFAGPFGSSSGMLGFRFRIVTTNQPISCLELCSIEECFQVHGSPRSDIGIVRLASRKRTGEGRVLRAVRFRTFQAIRLIITETCDILGAAHVCDEVG